MSKGKEILQVIEAVANEKALPREVIFEAIEAALASAARRRHAEDIDVRVEIDRSTGDYEAFRRWEVISDDEEETELESEDQQIRLTEARQHDADLEVGDFIEEIMEPPECSGISAHADQQRIARTTLQD